MTARSWDCATGPFRSRASSSTRSRSPPSPATRCSRTSCNSTKTTRRPPCRFLPTVPPRCPRWRGARFGGVADRGEGSMAITPSEALVRCIEHREIFHDEMLALWRKLISGELSPVQIAAVLMGLRVKKETIGEIAAAARIMREFATPVAVADRSQLVDLCGTGGDGAGTFNISTAAMFVAAAGGARVAKHGGGGVLSGAGSAGVLEALGATIMFTPSP